MKIEHITNRLTGHGLTPENWEIVEMKEQEVKLQAHNGDRILLDFIKMPEPPKKGILGRPKK